jgi:PPOX class probable F420-dependent enzyme
MPSAAEVLQPFVKQRWALLTSFKRDGGGVGTPVCIAVEGGHAYLRTGHNTWKVKRMRNVPVVELAPSSFRGKPTGRAARMSVRRLEGDEASAASARVARKYRFLEGVLVPVVFKIARVRMVHYELTPEVDAAASP